MYQYMRASASRKFAFVGNRDSVVTWGASSCLARHVRVADAKQVLYAARAILSQPVLEQFFRVGIDERPFGNGSEVSMGTQGLPSFALNPRLRVILYICSPPSGFLALAGVAGSAPD